MDYEDTNKWQDIIKNNFIIYNALFDSPKYYLEELAGGAAYWADDVQEEE
mgnify:FL=1